MRTQGQARAVAESTLAMDPTLWTLLHDGGIDAIDGSVPGTLTLTVSIQYLRERFPGDGDGFAIVLSDCTEFAFAPWDGPPLTDLAAIAACEPEILDAEAGDALTIGCTAGTLRTRYAAAAIRLDTGGAVTVDELTAAAQSYWAEWSARRR
jgi:hypothetical protein